MKKKLTCCLAVILTLCFLPIQVFATSIQPRREFYVVMSLCAIEPNWGFDSNSSVLGHAFLTFHNESDFTIRVGHMSVPAGDSITIGTFPKTAHDGIWYNIEAYEQPSNVYALEYVLTETELEQVNTRINSHNSYNVLTDNCTHFACGIWNATVSNNLRVATGQPQWVVDDIQAKNNYFSNYQLPRKSSSSVAYHTVSGVTYNSSAVS